jgi:Cof subfamily protein (haloacid dehalogenase superfamily)
VNNIKFIAADMDGSLLNDNKQLPDDFYEIFEQLKARGVMFAAASGRQYESLLETFGSIKDEMLFISDNGTLVMHQDKELHSSTIDQQSVKQIINNIQAIDSTYIILCGKGIAYIDTQEPEALSEIRKYYAKVKHVDDLLSVEDDIIKIAVLNFNGTEKHVYPVASPLFSDSLQVVVSAHVWLDFMEKSASKGTAIKIIRERFGFSYEQCMSFGDYFNDVEMLKETHFSYAMENAHPEIKKLARFIAPTNNESGVTRIIREKVLKA